MEKTTARPGSRPAELALPVKSLAAMRVSLTKEVGPDVAARALRAAGYASGDAFFLALTQAFGEGGGSPQFGGLGLATFWRRISQLFSTRGWGTFAHESVHPGIGALDSVNWVEALPESALRPSCFYTTGLLANLLGQTSGEEVAVLEVECRSRGDQRCRFLFGAPQTLKALYGRVRLGEPVDESITALT